MVGVCFMRPDPSGCILEQGRKTPLTAPLPLTLSGAVLQLCTGSSALLSFHLLVRPLLPASPILLGFLNIQRTKAHHFRQRSTYYFIRDWPRVRTEPALGPKPDRDPPFADACSEVSNQGRQNGGFLTRFDQFVSFLVEPLSEQNICQEARRPLVCRARVGRPSGERGKQAESKQEIQTVSRRLWPKPRLSQETQQTQHVCPIRGRKEQTRRNTQADKH